MPQAPKVIGVSSISRPTLLACRLTSPQAFWADACTCSPASAILLLTTSRIVPAILAKSASSWLILVCNAAISVSVSLAIMGDPLLCVALNSSSAVSIDTFLRISGIGAQRRQQKSQPFWLRVEGMGLSWINLEREGRAIPR